MTKPTPAALRAAEKLTGGDKIYIVPCCQREGCGKPLRNRLDRVHLYIRTYPHQPGVDCIFCKDCADEIQTPKGDA